jgi:ABC-2 type transport system permease protein
VIERFLHVAGTATAVEIPRRQPGVLALYSPKFRAARRRATEGRSVARALLLGGVGLVFWLVLFTILYRILAYFNRTPGLGDVLAVKLLATMLLAFLPILLLSNIITALSSFFLANDLELIAAAPLDPLRVYGARLLETAVHSSWMIVLVLVPVLAAYATVFHAPPGFYLVMPVALITFLVLPAVVGTAMTQILVNVFPARRARDILALVALLGAAAFVAVFRMMRPEQLARPEGFRDLVDFIAALRTPQNVWLPSDWAANALLARLGITERPADLFPLLLLASTAAAFLVLGAWGHGRLFLNGLSRAQEGGRHRGAPARSRWIAERATPLPLTARNLVLKDLRTFFRDTTQWSQLILLAVLVVVYVYNIKVLPLFSGEDVGFLLRNVVVFLNTGLAGFVLAAIAARLVFPAISLEGRSLWLLRSSPLRLTALVWSKFWVGLVPLLLIAVAITAGTNAILGVNGFVAAVSLGTIVALAFSLTSLALAFGAVYPKFNSENPADIPTSFGGLLFMMAAVAFIGIIILLEAWPVYSVLLARMQGRAIGAAEWAPLIAGLGSAFGACLLMVVLSVRTAVRRVEAIEQ